jgi:hypothetical protein
MFYSQDGTTWDNYDVVMHLCVCVYVRMYVRMYMYIYVYIYVYIYYIHTWTLFMLEPCCVSATLNMSCHTLYVTYIFTCIHAHACSCRCASQLPDHLHACIITWAYTYTSGLRLKHHERGLQHATRIFVPEGHLGKIHQICFQKNQKSRPRIGYTRDKYAAWRKTPSTVNHVRF